MGGVKTDEPTLAAYRVVAASLGARAAVTILWESGVSVDAEAEGGDAVEALFRAVDCAVGVQDSISGSFVHEFTYQDGVGKASVRVTLSGREYTGVDSSTDPLDALGCAYVCAISSYLERFS
jgi:hypothetical protein